MTRPNDDVHQSILRIIGDFVLRNFWAFVVTVVSVAWGWASATSGENDLARQERSELSGRISTIERSMLSVEQTQGQRRGAIACAVRTLERMTDRLNIQPPCPLELPE